MHNPALTVTTLWHDDKYGYMFVLETKREHMELRVTPSGLLRLGKPGRGEHPHLKAVRAWEARERQVPECEKQ